MDRGLGERVSTNRATRSHLSPQTLRGQSHPQQISKYDPGKGLEKAALFLGGGGREQQCLH